MKERTSKIQEEIEKTLLADRKIFLWGTIDDKTARHVIERFLYLDAQNNDEIQLILSSPGGYVTAGFAIYDTMQALKSPVSTICSGISASMAAVLLSAGAKGRRFIQPHANVMIHQPSGGAQGQASNIEIQAAEILRIRDLSARILAENCNQDYNRILKDFNRDYWMHAEESVEYGIVDGIIGK